MTSPAWFAQCMLKGAVAPEYLNIREVEQSG